MRWLLAKFEKDSVAELDDGETGEDVEVVSVEELLAAVVVGMVFEELTVAMMLDDEVLGMLEEEMLDEF